MSTAYQKLVDTSHHVFVINRVRTSHNKPPVRVILETSGQHTLKWHDIELSLDDGRTVKLPTGECNLYLFPAAVIGNTATTLVGEHRQALEEV